MPEVVANGVPKDRVGEVVQSFVSFDGATHVVVEKKAENDYTVTATIP